jgi:hypothetical protein
MTLIPFDIALATHDSNLMPYGSNHLDRAIPSHEFSSASSPTAFNIAAADALANRFWTRRM